MIFFGSELSWAALPSYLYLIPLGLIGIGALVYRLKWQQRTSRLLQSTPGLLSNFSMLRAFIKALLKMLALIFLLLALGRPQSAGKKESIEQSGRNVLIALDISRSMLAQDFKPSRLLLAKQKIKELVEGLTSERVALMLFSDAPFIQCPFTSDITAFLSFLDLVDVESISTGTTALDKALAQALELFGRIPTSRNNSMVIFTDGEDFSSSLSGFQEKAKALGLHIFTVGTATAEGAPIPLYNEKGEQIGHQKDKSGAIVISRLNAPLLAELANKTGGGYRAATQDSSDMQELIADIKSLEKEKFDVSEVEVKQENYGIVAFISLVLLLIEWIL